MTPTVLIIQEQVPPYRIPFFRILSEMLNRRGLDLSVASSSALPETDRIGFRHRRALTSKGGLPALQLIHRTRPTVLVLPHSLRFAPVAAVTRTLQCRGRRQLFWGSGMARRYGEGEARDRRLVADSARRMMLSVCDHYLSYTDLSTANLMLGGYDPERITTLNNSVEALATAEEAAAAQRTPLQVLFVASLVEDKEPLRAVEIVDKLRQIEPAAALHIVGDGPLRPQCEHAAECRQSVQYHGALRGQLLRDLALASDIAVIPGRIGLAVLEMASAGLPMATFAASLHCAEITYLKDGINGLLLSGSPYAAAKELRNLLTDRPAMERMRSEALTTASRYTVEDMAANFADGIATSLS